LKPAMTILAEAARVNRAVEGIETELCSTSTWERRRSGTMTSVREMICQSQKGGVTRKQLDSPIVTPTWVACVHPPANEQQASATDMSPTWTPLRACETCV
jgi:hypothetical protein